MLLQPKRTKYRKTQKGRNKGIASRGYKLAFAKYGIKAMEPGFMSSAQIERARVAFSRAIRGGSSMATKSQIFRRVFPIKPITKKPAEVRMGKGKGAIDHWVAPIKPGTILYELGGVSQEVADKAIKLVGSKLGFKTRMVIDKTR